MTDTAGNQPNLLVLTSSGNTVDLSDFPSDKWVIQEDNPVTDSNGAHNTFLTLNGTENVHLVLGTLQSPTDVIGVTDNVVGKTTLLGSGASLILNANATQTVVVKDGGNVINCESGNLTVKLAGDNNSVNIEGANGTETSLSAILSGLNSTDVVHFNGPLSDYSIVKTTNTLGDKVTEVTLVGVQTQTGNEAVTFNGWHQAVTFADPANGYVAGPVHYI